MDPSRPETPAEVEARRIRETAARRRPPTDRSGGGLPPPDPVAAALRSLPPGWSQVGVVATEPPGRVVVGAGGVFVVRAFTPAGPLTLERGVLLEDGEASAAAAGLLETVAPVRGLAGTASRRTTAVLCASSDVPMLRGSDVWVCSAADLVRVLTGGPLALTPGEVAGAGIRLTAALRPARAATDPAGEEASPASQVPTAVKVVVAVLLLLALLLIAPRLGEGLGSAFGVCRASSASC